MMRRNILKTLGYGAMLCTALTFANPCHGDGLTVTGSGHSILPAGKSLEINTYDSAAWGPQTPAGIVKLQNGATIARTGDATNPHALRLSLGALPNFPQFITENDASVTLSGYSGEAPGAGIYIVRPTELKDSVAGNRIDLFFDGLSHTIEGYHGILIDGLKSASGNTPADIVNITFGGRTNNITGSGGSAIKNQSVAQAGIINVTVKTGSDCITQGNIEATTLTLESGSESAATGFEGRGNLTISDLITVGDYANLVNLDGANITIIGESGIVFGNNSRLKTASMLTTTKLTAGENSECAIDNDVTATTITLGTNSSFDGRTVTADKLIALGGSSIDNKQNITTNIASISDISLGNYVAMTTNGAINSNGASGITIGRDNIFSCETIKATSNLTVGDRSKVRIGSGNSVIAGLRLSNKSDVLLDIGQNGLSFATLDITGSVQAAGTNGGCIAIADESGKAAHEALPYSTITLAINTKLKTENIVKGAYLTRFTGATGHLDFNLKNIDTDKTKLGTNDKIILCSGTVPGSCSGITENMVNGIIKNKVDYAKDIWFANPDASDFLLQFGAENKTAYLIVDSDFLFLSHYVFGTNPGDINERKEADKILIYPRFANTKSVPNLREGDFSSPEPGEVDCHVNSPHVSHLIIQDKSAFVKSSGTVTAVSIRNDFESGGTWDQGSTPNQTPHAVLISIAEAQRITSLVDGPTGDSIGISVRDPNKYIPAIIIEGSGQIESTSSNGNAYGIKLEGSSWAQSSNIQDSSANPLFNNHAYVFNTPISVQCSPGQDAYGVYINNQGKESPTIYIGNDISINGTSHPYAIKAEGNVSLILNKEGTTSGARQTITGNVICEKGNVTLESDSLITGLASGSMIFKGGTQTTPKYHTINGSLAGTVEFKDYTVNKIAGSLTAVLQFGSNSTTTLELKNICGSLISSGQINLHGNIPLIAIETGLNYATNASLDGDLRLDNQKTNGIALNIGTNGGKQQTVFIRTAKNEAQYIKANTTDGTAIKGQSGESGTTLILAGKGGIVEGKKAIDGVQTLVFGRHKGAPEQAELDTNYSSLTVDVNDTDTNTWTLKGDSVVSGDVIVRHGNIVSEGNMTIGRRLYVLGCNFATSNAMTINGGIFHYEDTLTLDGGNQIVISNEQLATADDSFKSSDIQCTPKTKNYAGQQLPAAIVLDTDAKILAKSGIQDVSLTSHTVSGNAIGILAQGNNNEITFEKAPAFQYIGDDGKYSVKQAEGAHAVLNLSKIESTQTITGAIDVDTVVVNNQGTGAWKCENIKARIVTDLTTDDNQTIADVTTNKPIVVAKVLDGSTLAIKHGGGLTKDQIIPVVKYTNASDNDPQVELTKLTKLSLDKTTTNTYSIKVIDILTNVDAFAATGLNPSFAEMVDGWHSTEGQTKIKTFLAGASEKDYDVMTNWAARSDNLEKARIVSATIDAYNDQVVNHSRNHNFNMPDTISTWVGGFGSWFKQDKIKNIGAKADTYGVIVGTDYQFAQNWLLSLSFGYANSDVKIQGNDISYSGSGDQDNFIGNTSLTLQKQLGQGMLNATGLFTTVFTKHDYDYNFNISDNSYNGDNKAHSKYNGYAFAFEIDADWMLNAENSNFSYGPTVQLGFDRVVQDAHNLKCSQSDLSLYNEEAKNHNVWSMLGAKMEYAFNCFNKQGMASCKAGWEHRFNNNGANVSRSIVDSSYSASSEYTEKNAFILNLGVSLIATDKLNLGLEYGLKYGKKSTDNTANISCSYTF